MENSVDICQECGCAISDENRFHSWMMGNVCVRCGEVLWQKYLARLRENHAKQDKERRQEADRDGITCSGCNKHKPTTEFANNKNNYTTYDTRCKDCVRASIKKWSVTDRGQAKIKELGARRRSRAINQTGSASAEELRAVKAAQTDKKGRLRCWICGKPIKDTPHLDHFIPLSRGGAHDAGNLHYTHAHCNMSKSDKMPAELGRFL